ALQDFGQQWPSNGKPHPAEGRAEDTVRRTVDGLTNGHGALRQAGAEVTHDVVTDQSRSQVRDLDNMFRDVVVVATKLVRFEPGQRVWWHAMLDFRETNHLRLRFQS